jgi:ABC-type Zn uptake system ZnuABC Zn-binding protein ZnuA
MRKIAICLTAVFTLFFISGNSQEKTKVKTKTAAKKTVVKSKSPMTAMANGIGCSTNEH